MVLPWAPLRCGNGTPPPHTFNFWVFHVTMSMGNGCGLHGGTLPRHPRRAAGRPHPPWPRTPGVSATSRAAVRPPTAAPSPTSSPLAAGRCEVGASEHTHTHAARLIAEVGASLTTAEQKYPFAIHHDSEKCHDPPALPQVSGRSAGYESSPSCKVFAAQVIGATVATKRANLKQLHCCRPLPPWKLFPLTLHQ